MFFRKKKLSEEAFVIKLLDAIQKQNRGIRIISIEGLTVIVEGSKTGEHRFFFDNAFIEYQKEPKELKTIIKGFANAFTEIVNDNKNNDIEININNIIPIIKDYRFLETLREIDPNVEANHVYEQYNSELYIFYAEDNPQTIKYLKQEFFNNLGYTYTEFRELACENLDRILTINKYGDSYNNYAMVTVGGDYEASAILLNIWNNKNFPVNGNIVIGIPSRDMLLITGSKNSTGLHKLYDIIEETQQSNYLISDKLFEWDGAKFQLLK